MRKSQERARRSLSKALVNGSVGHSPAEKQDRAGSASPVSRRRVPTERQQTVFAFIRDFQAEHGYPPTIREIANQFGIRTTSGVMCHLRALQKLGIIDWTPSACRTLRVLSQPSPN